MCFALTLSHSHTHTDAFLLDSLERSTQFLMGEMRMCRIYIVHGHSRWVRHAINIKHKKRRNKRENPIQKHKCTQETALRPNSLRMSRRRRSEESYPTLEWHINRMWIQHFRRTSVFCVSMHTQTHQDRLKYDSDEHEQLL